MRRLGRAHVYAEALRHPLRECFAPLRVTAVDKGPLDGADRGDCCELCLRLGTAPDDGNRAGVCARHVAGGHPARGSGAYLAECIPGEHGDTGEPSSVLNRSTTMRLDPCVPLT